MMLAIANSTRGRAMTFITKNMTNVIIAAVIGGLAVWAILQATQPPVHHAVGVVEVGEIQ
jgi:hypothetical protein